MNLTVRFKKLDEEAQRPTKSYAADAGWDLYVSRPVVVATGEAVDVHTDIAMAIEPGFYGHIIGRSSTLRRYGLRVTEAVIDAGYRGELFIQVQNMKGLGPTKVGVEPGMRLAQVIFHKVPVVQVNEVDELPNSRRGDNGFGSSGR